MKLKEPKNKNYCAVVVEIKQLVNLENCNNVQVAIIMGNQVIVDKSVKIGDIGLFFPLETQLSKEYLSANNLYRHKELNINKEKAGYFEENGRIRCVKFRGNKSEGLFMPLESLNFIDNDLNLNINDEFDEINNIEICRKYIVKVQNMPGSGNGSKKSKKPKESKIIDNQFRFHQDTSMLYKNMHKINPDDIISITYKTHGTSAISSKVLCKKQLKWYEKIFKILGLNIVDTVYDYIYSSRKVIKNSDLNPNAQHFYGEDIWGITHNEIKDFLQDGMTIYYEIVGFLPNGGYIQKDYDYGCSNPLEIYNIDFIIKNEGKDKWLKSYSNPPENHVFYKILIYRITYTNPQGKVFEFSAKQVQDWCKQNGLNAVPELFYGKAKDLFPFNTDQTLEEWQNKFLEFLKNRYTEKDCYICENKVSEEGIVLRPEKNDFEAYKLKSERFYLYETKLLDKGESDIESEN